MTLRDGPLWAVLLAVGAGAAIGACLRWAASLWLNGRWEAFPLGTLACNWAGGFAIGLVTAWLAAAQLSPLVKLFCVTGLLGGLTTFSTFSLESVALIADGQLMRALGHSGAHLAGSVLLAAAGLRL
ncbi:MAG: fluoride efflux transporter CrcB, partial [Duodenibacillus sp.]|nr:fluoride efflux transporter CrcB [Duodenibacillus sp.]